MAIVAIGLPTCRLRLHSSNIKGSRSPPPSLKLRTRRYWRRNPVLKKGISLAWTRHEPFYIAENSMAKDEIDTDASISEWSPSPNSFEFMTAYIWNDRKLPNFRIVDAISKEVKAHKIKIMEDKSYWRKSKVCLHEWFISCSHGLPLYDSCRCRTVLVFGLNSPKNGLNGCLWSRCSNLRSSCWFGQPRPASMWVLGWLCHFLKHFFLQ